MKYPVDIFYYMASAWKELNFSPDTLLCLNTSEEMKEELIPYLSKCFSNVELTPIETEIRKGKSLTYDFRLFLNEDY
ncbi:MAG TPA: hypothetical protein DDY68_05330 [Porphyromonadaceae bacterium]|nr:hypothetical protein [Porphyromonadaceae bacterium]